jgi:hypothetical protein
MKTIQDTENLKRAAIEAALNTLESQKDFLLKTPEYRERIYGLDYELSEHMSARS